MSTRPLLIACLFPMLFGSGCTNKDREEAAKKDDAVATFRYKPGDGEKYRKKDEKTSPVQPSAAPSPAVGDGTPSAPTR